MTETLVRLARSNDAAAILQLIKELAAFEHLSDEVRATEADILRDGFGASPRFECLIAERHGKAIGFALFFHSYSTFEGRAGLYLEDLFVLEDARGIGVGRKLMCELAKLALERNCARLELSVLHWNPARTFYDQLGFMQQEDWLPYRVNGDSLKSLAEAF
ncbi:GNAT family N-acetyltransferase [Pelagibius sp. Alg239-R121]|uniref:GNAT family N-acetyltransferase n=1 Tax=Pelagibius sp. Alg239-R121 TaxID=2993448 RepID=UPI0024A6B32C|nr:GNAT family N-acetyltransferase [Pelagibius sp. Alg239-R121]